MGDNVNMESANWMPLPVPVKVVDSGEGIAIENCDPLNY